MKIFKLGSALFLLALAACLLAPYLRVEQYGKRVQASLERSLGRTVKLGNLHFSLIRGPLFWCTNVTIYEDPAIGVEPVAYIQETGTLEVAPSLLSLLGGRFVISSIRIENASINLVKTEAAKDPGRWNFASFANRSLMSSVPAIHIRNSRINFKFGDTKSVFYLTETDLDVSPPATRGGGWRVYCAAKPARTDRTNQGLGAFTIQGRWYLAPERLDLDAELDRTGVGEITALVRGQSGNVHGNASARLHMGGPLSSIGITGRMTIEDVHRWDLLPGKTQYWPIDVFGHLDLTSQSIELQTTSVAGGIPPITVRFRATDFLTRPHWAVAVNWNHFEVPPLMELATHIGAVFPPKLRVSGTMDGAIVYSGEGNLQGQMGFRQTTVSIPDSPPVAFERAYVVVDHGHVHLSPAVVHTADDQAQVDFDYALDDQTLDLTISTEAMKVASLRAQAALAAVPWLEQVNGGRWSGQLRYHRDSENAGWTGRLQLDDAQIPLPGLADPLELNSARAQIDGKRVVLDQIDARAGKVGVSGSYSYEPADTHPHHLRLRIEELDAADLEAELMPTLRYSSGLIARALGRSAAPDWLRQRALDGTLQIDTLKLAGSQVENIRTRVLWDVARIELDNLQARVDRAAVTGRLLIALHGNRPSYRLTGKVKGLPWQSGKIDAEGTLETAGTGEQLLANLTSEGTFTASTLDFGTVPVWRNVSGSCNLAWSPKLKLTGVNLKMEDETFTGRGSTQDDGRLLILLSNGTRDLRMSGTLANLKMEESPRQ